jgi:hypothetical protein
VENNKPVSVLAQKALLVQLRINQWSGVKQDAKARQTVENTHKTDNRVGELSEETFTWGERVNRHCQCSSKH